MMSTRLPGSIARQRSFDKEPMQDDNHAWTRLAANTRYRSHQNGGRNRREDLGCPLVATVLGIGLVLFGIYLVWVADLSRTQLAQLEQVRAEQEAWNTRFRSRWMDTKWELLVNGTRAGQLTPQPATTEISDSHHMSVTSSKQTRLNLLGSVFTAADLYQITAEGHEQLTADSMTTPVNISVQLCMKMSYQEDAGAWDISTRFGGPGCSLQRPAQGLTAARIPVPQWRNSTPPQLDPVQAYKSEVGVYEAHDPYLFVANLTSGSMTLAESSINSAACGIVAMVLGAVLLVPFVLLKAIDLWEARQRKRIVKLNALSFDEIPLQQCTISKY